MIRPSIAIASNNPGLRTYLMPILMVLIGTLSSAHTADAALSAENSYGSGQIDRSNQFTLIDAGFSFAVGARPVQAIEVESAEPKPVATDHSFGLVAFALPASTDTTARATTNGSESLLNGRQQSLSLSESDRGDRPENRSASTSQSAATESVGRYSALAIVGLVLLALSLFCCLKQMTTLRRLRDALARSQAKAKYHELIASNPANAVVFADKSGAITWVNSGFEQLTGFHLQEVIGKRPGDFLQCEATDKAEVDRLRQAIRQCQPIVIELLNKTKQGRQYWVEIRLNPVTNVDGRLEGFLAIEVDVTERRLMSALLQETLARHEGILNALNQRAMVATLSQTGVFEDVNQRMLKSIGVGREQLIGKDIRTMVAALQMSDSVEQMLSRFAVPARRNESRSVLNQSSLPEEKTAETSWRGVISGVTLKGEPFWVDASISRIECGRAYHPGQVLTECFIFIGFDITERVRAGQREQEQMALLYSSIETIAQPFCIFDQADRLVYCNDRYRATYATSAEVIKPGATYESIARYGAERGQYREAIGCVEEWVQKRVRQHQSGDFDALQSLDDGTVLRVLERRTPTGHIVVFPADISDLVQAREEALIAARTKGQFLANMSHEIRTPMNAVLGMLSLLGNTRLDSRQADYLDKAHVAGTALMQILNDILDVSKVSAGMMALEDRSFDLFDMVRDLSAMLSSSVGEKSLELLMNVSADSPRWILGDRTRLLQILLNLTANAIKFTEKGSVELSIEPVQWYNDKVRLLFSVTDTGIGIAPEDLGSIFEQFTQADSSRTRTHGGTGLGVTISSQLVDLMGGELRVQSELGEGSRFYFDIEVSLSEPVDAGTASAGVPAFESERSPERAIKVLVIEAQPQARDILVNISKSLGWDVHSCEDLNGGLSIASDAKARGAPIQLLFVDHQAMRPPGRLALNMWQGLYPDCKVIPTLNAHDLTLENDPKQSPRVTSAAVLLKPLTLSAVMEVVSGIDLDDASNEGLQNRDSTQAGGLAPAPDEAEPLAGRTFLLVEDNIINQQVAKELLIGEGAFVNVASNGQLAVDALRESPWFYDAVLMDMQMPVMNGLEATRVIREELLLTDLPIIAMTANAMTEDRDVCLEAGMNAHIPKPLHMDQVVKVLLASLRKNEDDCELTSDTPEKSVVASDVCD